MDTKTVGIIGNIVKFGLILAGFILVAFILSSDSLKKFKTMSAKETTNILSGEFEEDNKDLEESVSYIDAAVKVAIAAIGIALVLAVLFAVFFFVTNIKGSIGAFIGIAALAIVFLIAYSMSDGNLMDGWSKLGVTENISKMSGAGIMSFFILLGVAVAATLFTEVSKIIK